MMGQHALEFTKRSFQQYVNDAISEGLKSTLATDEQEAEEIAKEELVTSGPEENKV